MHPESPTNLHQASHTLSIYQEEFKGNDKEKKARPGRPGRDSLFIW